MFFSFPPTTLLICDNFLSVISIWVWVGHEAQNTRPACGLAGVRSNVRRDDAMKYMKYVYFSLFVSDKLYVPKNGGVAFQWLLLFLLPLQPAPDMITWLSFVRCHVSVNIQHLMALHHMTPVTDTATIKLGNKGKHGRGVHFWSHFLVSDHHISNFFSFLDKSRRYD